MKGVVVIDISIRAITYETARNIEASAATSLFWQMPHNSDLLPQVFDTEFEKQLWIQRVLFEWGICGYTAFVSTGEEGSTPLPAATVIFAPPKYLPGTDALPSGPVSTDAILITSVYVALPYMGLYLEHQLIDIVLEEARRRGIKAVEAFARVEELDEELTARLMNVRGENISEEIANYIPESYRGWEIQLEAEVMQGMDATLDSAPMLSEDILEERCFHVVQHHPKYPRYRKEISPSSGLFARQEEDEHANLNSAEKLGTVTGGGAMGRKKQPTLLKAGQKNPFL